MSQFFFAICLGIDREIFRVAGVECPYLFRPNAPAHKPNRLPDEAAEISTKRIAAFKDINKLNQRVAEITKRNPDDLLRKPFVEWCSVAQIGFEMERAKPKKQTTKKR